MKIGQLSKRSGLSRDTIRFYERSRLITSLPSQSAQNTYRNYPEELVDRLEMIGAAQDAGLPLSDLKILLDTMEGNTDQSLDINVFLTDRIAQIEYNIHQSQKFLDTLKATQMALESAVLPENLGPKAKNTDNLTS
jgi:DNA-binding transcriptional MerR regulator